MISRLMGLAASIVGYFCVATCIAEAIMVGYVWSNWQLDREKVVQILAIAHGIDIARAPAEEEDAPTTPPEQVSLEQISEARAIHVRHLELREEAVKNAIDQLRFERQKLVDERVRYDKQKKEFETKLAAMIKDASSGGIVQLTAILEKLKPKQAKGQILQMLADDKMNDVVMVFSGMQDSKRAKIIAEFRTPEESEKLNEVLRRIREGVPKSSLAQQTEQQLQMPPKGP